MRTLVIGIVCLYIFLSPKLSAQRGGAPGGGSPGAASRGAGRGGHPAGGPGIRPPGNFGPHPSTPLANSVFDRRRPWGSWGYGYAAYALPAFYPWESYSPAEFGWWPYQENSPQQPV